MSEKAQLYPSLKEPVYAIYSGKSLFLLTDDKLLAEKHHSHRVSVIKLDNVGIYGKCNYWQNGGVHPFYVPEGENFACNNHSPGIMCKECKYYSPVGDNYLR